ncbi:MAG TPA: mannonate dehydratase [Ktedonobacterales bacterium]|nr:mannonate dehydratase [Ktedonobacterales bacterium]
MMRRIPDARQSADWGVTQNQGKLWTLEELRDLRDAVRAEGLELAAIENFDPSHWYDILLDGPRKQEQFEDLKTIIRRLGQAGIPFMGYNFSIAGVWGHITGPYARGGAESVGFSASDGPPETPLRNGQVWNMTYDPDAPPGNIGPITHDQLWERLTEFLQTLVPIAAEANVKLAAHPDDPPMPTIRGTPRLVYQPQMYQRLLDIVPSPFNCLEFCQGTIAEMSEGDVYEAIDQYSRQGRLGYVHFRNIIGKVPEYHEVFVDEGDVDMFRALRIYHKNGYDGVLIPDHTPQMTCDAPWHAGMAFALGYMRAAIRAVEST